MKSVSPQNPSTVVMPRGQKPIATRGDGKCSLFKDWDIAVACSRSGCELEWSDLLSQMKVKNGCATNREHKGERSSTLSE